MIDARTLRRAVFDKTIGANREGAGLNWGGDVNVFAWADIVAGPDRKRRGVRLRP